MDKWDLLGSIFVFLTICFIFFLYVIGSAYEETKSAKCRETGNVPYYNACIKPGSFVNVEMK